MSEKGEDLESLGLICHSYNSLFTIRKRLRKINDITIPVKRGLATNQIGVFIAAFFASAIVFGLLIAPLMRVMHLPRPWWLILLALFGPPVLAAQQVAKPMAYGKSIAGSFRSLMRFHLDDRVHRRGLPVPTNRRPAGTRVAHWQREWQMVAPLAELRPELAPVSDPLTETRLAAPSGIAVDLQTWLDAQSKQNLKVEADARSASQSDEDLRIHHKRGAAAKVYVPKDESQTKVKETV